MRGGKKTSFAALSPSLCVLSPTPLPPPPLPAPLPLPLPPPRPDRSREQPLRLIPPRLTSLTIKTIQKKTLETLDLHQLQVSVAQQAAKEIAGYKKAPLNITITGRKLSGLPLNLTGRRLAGLPLNTSALGRRMAGLPLNTSALGRRKLSGLPLNVSGRRLSGLPLNVSGRRLSGLPFNLSGAGRRLQTGINGNSSLIKLAPINVTYLHKAMKYPAPQAVSSNG